MLCNTFKQNSISSSEVEKEKIWETKHDHLLIPFDAGDWCAKFLKTFAWNAYIENLLPYNMYHCSIRFNLIFSHLICNINFETLLFQNTKLCSFHKHADKWSDILIGWVSWHPQEHSRASRTYGKCSWMGSLVKGMIISVAFIFGLVIIYHLLNLPMHINSGVLSGAWWTFPLPLLVFRFFTTTPDLIRTHPIIKFEEIDFVTNSSFYFLYLLILLTPNFQGKITYIWIYFAFFHYGNLFLFFPSLYNHSKPFFKFWPPVYFDPPFIKFRIFSDPLFIVTPHMFGTWE